MIDGIPHRTKPIFTNRTLLDFIDWCLMIGLPNLLIYHHYHWSWFSFIDTTIFITYIYIYTTNHHDVSYHDILYVSYLILMMIIDVSCIYYNGRIITHCTVTDQQSRTSRWLDFKTATDLLARNWNQSIPSPGPIDQLSWTWIIDLLILRLCVHISIITKT